MSLGLLPWGCLEKAAMIWGEEFGTETSGGWFRSRSSDALGWGLDKQISPERTRPGGGLAQSRSLRSFHTTGARAVALRSGWRSASGT